MFFALLLVDGYALNLLGLTASPAVILAMLVVEGGLGAFWISRRPLELRSDPLELAGFLFVAVGTWLYVVFPSWPTLVPPSYSGDAANHLAYINIIFSSGRIFGDYPGGPALAVATIAHWIGWLPLRLEHPLAALWLALVAGGVYLVACEILPDRRVHRITALLAAVALYVPSVYFAGMLIGPQYFMTQVAAQLYLLAFALFLVLYLGAPHPFWAMGMALCLFTITVSFPLWLALPLAMFAWVLFLEWRSGRVAISEMVRLALRVVAPPAVFWVTIVLTGGYYISSPSRLSAPGAVIPPSFEGLGGWLLLLPALGLVLFRRAGKNGGIVAAFLAIAVLQSIALLAGGRLLRWNDYWANKSFYVWMYPLALLAVIPFAWLLERVREHLTRPHTAPAFGFAAACLVITAGIVVFIPPPVFTPLTESDIQVALWTKEHLDTFHVNYVGAQNLTAHWLVRLWDEHLPADLFVALPALGPKTFEEWRIDPYVGEYLFVSSRQHFAMDPGLQIVYRWGDSEIVRKATAPGRAESTETLGRFGGTLALVDYALGAQTVHAGDVISLTAQIETLHVPGREVAWRLQLRDLSNNAIAEKRSDIFGNKYPLQRWPDGMVVPEGIALPLPADVRPGLYDLQLGLYGVGDGQPEPFRPAEGQEDDVIHLGRIKVALAPVTTHELAAATRMDVKLGNAFKLIGYRLANRAGLHPGDAVKLYLYWQSLQAVPQDYTVFVHLLDSQGSLRAQKDTAPRGGTYPTSIWDEKEVIVDPYTLTVPGDAMPGDYRLEIGMYVWPSLARLPVTLHDCGPTQDHLILPEMLSVIAK